MNEIFRGFWKVITNLTYGFQDFKGVLHEENMIEILLERGMVDASLYGGLKKDELLMLKNDFTPGDDISHLGFKDGTFIYQPYSSHGAPDFVIFVNNTYIMMELKSAKGENIQWNTHVPQKNWIYVFTSKSHKKTTYFLGQEIVPDEMRPHLEELIALEKHHKEIMKQIWLKLPGNKFKFWNYNRPMYMADLKLFTDGETLDREVKVNDFINNILNGK